MVVLAALELIGDEGIAGFSVAKLGKRLNASAMSLYTYFDSRDALLEAVADNVFNTFEAPAPIADWKAYILAWLEAITEHFRRFPVALSVIAWDDHLSAGWLRAWLPVVRALSLVQSDPRRLGDALSWFSYASIGLIQGRFSASDRLADLDETMLSSFPEEDHRLLDLIHRHHRERDSSWVLTFGFENIVFGLEAILLDKRTVRSHSIDCAEQP